MVHRYWERKYSYSIFTFLLVILSPFLLWLHKLFDNTPGSSVIKVFFLSYDHGYDHHQAFIWSLLVRLVPVILLTIWYLHSPYWWRHFVLIPIATFSSSFLPVFLDAPSIFSYAIFITLFIITVLLIDIWLGKWIEKNSTGLKLSVLDINANWRRYYQGIRKFLAKNADQKQLMGSGEELKSLYGFKAALNEKRIPFDTWSKRTLFQVTDVLIILSLLFIPLLYHLYLFAPENEDSWKIWVFKIDNHGFNDVFAFVWYFSIKVCILIPLCLWFITSPHWWRYALFSPIIFFSHQLWESFQDDSVSLDESQYLYFLPVVFLLSLVLILISRTIKYQSKIMDTYEGVSSQIEEILKSLEERDNYSKESRQRFLELKKDLNKKDSKSNLQELIKLKQDLLEKLS